MKNNSLIKVYNSIRTNVADMADYSEGTWAEGYYDAMLECLHMITDEMANVLKEDDDKDA